MYGQKKNLSSTRTKPASIQKEKTSLNSNTFPPPKKRKSRKSLPEVALIHAVLNISDDPCWIPKGHR
jgi:hypothetical protein